MLDLLGRGRRLERRVRCRTIGVNACVSSLQGWTYAARSPTTVSAVPPPAGEEEGQQQGFSCVAIRGC